MTKRTASRLDWADRVARWRARAPKQRAAITDGDTRYYFAGKRFVHCIRVRELSRMEYEVQYSAT